MQGNGERISTITAERGFGGRQTFKINGKNWVLDGTGRVSHGKENLIRWPTRHRKKKRILHAAVGHHDGTGGGARRELVTCEEFFIIDILRILRIGASGEGASNSSRVLSCVGLYT